MVSAPRQHAVVFTLTAVVLVAYALPGGAYDVVVRGQAATLVWWVLLLGVAMGLLPRSAPRGSGWIPLAGLLALAAWTAVAFGWTESDERTSIELARVVHHLGLLALTVALLRREDVPAAIGGACAGGVVVVLVALGARLFPGPFPDDIVVEALDVDRLSYPLNYWNGVAVWGAMTAVLALGFSAHATRPALRAAALAVVPLAAAVIYLAYSRQGALGLVVGSGVVFAFARTRALVALHAAAATLASAAVVLAIRRADEIASASGTGGRWGVTATLLVAMGGCAAVAVALQRWGADERLVVPRAVARRLTIGAGVAAVVLLAIATPIAIDSFTTTTGIERGADTASRLGDLSGNRANEWRSAFDAFEAHPIKGTGPGTFEFWWNRQGIDGEIIRDPHSLFIGALAESGLPGALLLLVVCGGLAWGLVRLCRGTGEPPAAGAAAAAAGAGSAWLVSCCIDWMWSETAVTAMALVLGGAAVAGMGAPVARQPRGRRAGLALVCLVALLAGLPPLVGTSAIRRSQDAAAAGDLGVARADAQDAVDAWPWAATPLQQRALVNEAAGAPRAAIVDARRAASREPTNWRHPLLLSRLEAELGDVPAALRDFRRARDLRPLSPLFDSN